LELIGDGFKGSRFCKPYQRCEHPADQQGSSEGIWIVFHDKHAHAVFLFSSLPTNA
jgi:hypothetical protein